MTARGLPAVRGEIVEGDVAGYHYYPGRERVLAWIAAEGLEVVTEEYWAGGRRVGLPALPPPVARLTSSAPPRSWSVSSGTGVVLCRWPRSRATDRPVGGRSVRRRPARVTTAAVVARVEHR